MNKLDKLAKALVESQERTADTSPYDTTATVTRIEGDTAWVHIPGGVDETPVKLTISAGKGDTVQVRVSGGTAYIIGNSSRPPTDDRVANVAKAKADTAQATADDAVKSASVATTKAVFAQETADGAQETAQDAHKIAADTAQYFWVTETGTDTGAHITEVSQESFVNNPSGGNLLARSNGIAVRDGLTELATFGANGATIGKTDEYNVRTTPTGIKFADGTTDTFEISGAVDGFYRVGTLSSKSAYGKSRFESWVLNEAWDGHASTIIESSGSNEERPSARIGTIRNENGATAEFHVMYSGSKFSTIGAYAWEDDCYASMTADQVHLNGETMLSLQTNQSSGTDHDLYVAITALGWDGDVIE